MIRVIRKVSSRIQAKTLLEPEFGFGGQIIFNNGKSLFFRDKLYNINYVGSADIAQDKSLTNYLLKTAGYKVPEECTFFRHDQLSKINIKRDIHAGFSYAQKLGFPVILKPVDLSQGKLVVKVHNKREYYSAAKQIFKSNRILIIQRFYPGRDYRILVLNGEVVAAYERIPLSLTGDGHSSIKELLRNKQEVLVRNGRDVSISEDDFRIKAKLARQTLALDSVLSAGDTIYPLDNANLSTGGNAVDITASLHVDFYRLAVEITKTMKLKFCGVDVITDDLMGPLRDYIVLEVNGEPGLFHYYSLGEKQALAVEDIYLKILRIMENEDLFGSSETARG
jgi:D-alanine-D-alanine ligase-like ATP-grasp enzyme